MYMHENEVGFKNELYKKQYNIEHLQLRIGMVDHAGQTGKINWKEWTIP